MSAPRRAVDPGITLAELAEEVLVACPDCGRPAWSRLRPGAHGIFGARRLACGACALVRDWSEGALVHGVPRDPAFGAPLWLQTPVGRELLWAYGPAHLAVLTEWIGADLREGAGAGRNASMLSRLPAWMTAAGKRDAVLRGLSRLEALLAAAT